MKNLYKVSFMPLVFCNYTLKQLVHMSLIGGIAFLTVAFAIHIDLQSATSGGIKLGE
jgi:hypothetical protein